MTYPTGGTEKNLLVHPAAGIYRITKPGFDVRTANPATNPSQFLLTETSPSVNFIEAVGSATAAVLTGSNSPVPQATSNHRLVGIFKVGNVYYQDPSMKGAFYALATYGTDISLGFKTRNFPEDPFGPAKVEMPSRAAMQKNAGSATWSSTLGFTYLNYASSPITWILCNLAPVTPSPVNPGSGKRFKMRSAATGGGFMIARNGADINSASLKDFIAHPDKRTLQVILSVSVTVAAGGSQTIPLAANFGKAVPLILTVSGTTYTTPFVGEGFAYASATFEYTASGFKISNGSTVVSVSYRIFFLNVELA